MLYSKLAKIRTRFTTIFIVLLLLGSLLFLFDFNKGKEQVTLKSYMRVDYDDGTFEEVFGSTPILQSQLSVIRNNGKLITNIQVESWLEFNNTPSDAVIETQYAGRFWMEIDGKTFEGERFYVNGFWGDIERGGTNMFDSVATDKLSGLRNVGFSGAGSYNMCDYYQEIGSGYLNLGCSLWIANAEQAKWLDDVELGDGLASYAGEQLLDYTSTHFPAVAKSDGDRATLVSWDREGYKFYLDMKRIAWDKVGSVSIDFGNPLTGDISFGSGKFLKMDDGDNYDIKFKSMVLYRYKDLTGEWSKWRMKTSTIATMQMNVAEGTWQQMDIDIKGDSNLDDEIDNCVNLPPQLRPACSRLP